MTYEEWLKMPEVEGIEEVVNGDMVKMPPNKVLHADTVENLADVFARPCWTAQEFRFASATLDW